MLRRLLPLTLGLLLVLPGVLALAEDAAEEEEPIPPLATDEEAAEALRVFKSDYRARGLQGDDKTAMREVAMRKLARTQHPDIADRLFKLTKDRNADIRTLALLYLGLQRAIPGYADEKSIFEELEYCEEVFKSIPNLRTIDVTDRSIEEISDWITHQVL